MITSPIKFIFYALLFLRLVLGAVLLAASLPFLFFGGMAINATLPMTNNVKVWPATLSILFATAQSFGYVVMAVGSIFKKPNE